MNRQDIITLIFTFFTGACIGVYLFFSGFMDVTDDIVPESDEAVTLEIISEAYGGCRTECPSFRVGDDGSFRYLYTPGFSADQVIREGTIPLPLQLELATVMNEQALRVQSEELAPAFCNSYTDGVDVRYTITRADVEYVLDTCGTTVDVTTPLWTALVKIWNHFETIE